MHCRVYFDNLNPHYQNIQHIQNHINQVYDNNPLQTRLKRFYTEQGMFISVEQNNTSKSNNLELFSIRIQDKPIKQIQVNNTRLTIDFTQYHIHDKVYQIPFNFKMEYVDSYVFKLSKTLSLILETSISTTNKTIQDIYFIKQLPDTFNINETQNKQDYTTIFSDIETEQINGLVSVLNFCV
jgi:DNA replication protein DnaD